MVCSVGRVYTNKFSKSPYLMGQKHSEMLSPTIQDRGSASCLKLVLRRKLVCAANLMPKQKIESLHKYETLNSMKKK